MSKYQRLWEYVQGGDSRLELDFSQIEQICGFPIDHSFLNAKKELEPYGWRVRKISLKEQRVLFEKERTDGE